MTAHTIDITLKVWRQEGPRKKGRIETIEALAAKGFTISTADEVSLLDSTCEMCGGCVAVCPTGAMGEKMPLTRGAKPEKRISRPPKRGSKRREGR